MPKRIVAVMERPEASKLPIYRTYRLRHSRGWRSVRVREPQQFVGQVSAVRFVLGLLWTLATGRFPYRDEARTLGDFEAHERRKGRR
jgi:hypothetical protein